MSTEEKGAESAGEEKGELKNFHVHLWDGFEKVYKRISKGRHDLKTLKAYLEARAKTESAYAAELKKVSTGLPDFSEPSSLSPCWLQAKDAGASLSKQHHQLGVQFTEISTVLGKAIDEIKKTKGKLHEKYTNLEKDRSAKEARHASARQAYIDAVKAAEGAIGKRDQGRAQNQPDKIQSKLEQAVKDSLKAMEAANAAYQKSVQQLKEAQVAFDNNQVTTLQQFEEMERKRLALLREQSLRIAQVHDALKGGVDQILVFLHKAVSDVKIEKDVQDFIKATFTGKTPKPHIEYVGVPSEIIDRASGGGSSIGAGAEKKTPGGGGGSQPPPPPGPPGGPSPTAGGSSHATSHTQKSPAAGSASISQKFATALYQFDANEADELGLQVGDVVKIIASPEEEDWWTGELNGKTGIFPKSYVEITAAPAAAKNPTSAPPASSTHGAGAASHGAGGHGVGAGAGAGAASNAAAGPGGETPKTMDARCSALFDFEGQDADELSFKAGDTLIITGELNGWYLGKTLTGEKVGIFPSNYVEVKK